MKRGTKIGWGLIALSAVLCGWIILSNQADAETTIDGLTFKDGELIGYDADQSSTQDIVIPSQYEDESGNLVDVTSIGENVFSGSDITSVSIPDTVTNIGDSAFYGTTQLITVTTPDSVTDIGANAFANSGVQYVTLPSNLTSFDPSIFTDCTALSSVAVSSDSGTYQTFDGCLYNASGTRLVYVPYGKTDISYYSGADTIASGAFSNNNSITNNTISDNITTIEDNAFTGSGVTELVIPPTVTTIGTQSGFVPDKIYGQAGSRAETFAQDLEVANNHTVFIVLGNSAVDPVDPTPVDPTPVDPTPVNPTPGSSDDTGSDDSGTDTPTPGPSYNPTTGGTTYYVRNDGTVVVSKDKTPDTADGFDTRYFLCIAVLFAGVAVILISRGNRMKYIADRVDR